MTSGNPLVMYGAGQKAITEMANVKREGKNPVCFCDTDTAKQGKTYLGLPVMSLRDAESKFGNVDIFITPRESVKEEIYHQLLRQGVSKQRIVN